MCIHASSGTSLLKSKKAISPRWCGSVVECQPVNPKGHQFNSQTGYMHGSRARSWLGGAQEATTH